MTRHMAGNRASRPDGVQVTGNAFAREPASAGITEASTAASPSNPWSIGANVPWSVAWTGEQSFTLQVSKDFPGLMDLVQVQRPGDGSPKFAAQHVTRHRLGMVRHLCHVCGEPTLKHDRYIFPIQSGGFFALRDGSVRYAGNVPPVHLECAKRAKRLCPHLTSTFAQPIEYPFEHSKVMPRTDVVAGMEELAKALPRGPKVVFSCYRLYGSQFTRRVEKLRKDYAAHSPAEAVLKIERLG